ncbi:MAG: COX15/CtaA family protein [Myxococcales bacterium]|nr:COX15/CtaA family protein [Myxococcales bacterium]
MSTLPPHNPPRSVRLWLLIVYAMIGAMVIIGGITRLTGSGLSMVEWHPLMGALPPLDETSWKAVFARYQLSPQYDQVNQWMTLADFKQIFFWEYLHRLFGRLIGVVFFAPWLVFTLRKQLRGRVAWRAGAAFVLGGAQGLLGWFMVKSGLVDVPEVSHFRLAAHLSLAFFVACWVQWLWMDLAWGRPKSDPNKPAVPGWAVWGLVSLITVQVVYGAFMAGKRAGLIFSTFPDMNGQWLPDGWSAGSSTLAALINNPIAIHFLHRTLAWFVLAAALAVGHIARTRAVTPLQTRLAWLLGGLTLVQVALGAATVMSHVNIPIATLHQGTALLLLSTALAVAHQRSCADDV